MNDSISIIIPVLNAGKYIKLCLDSLLTLDYIKDKTEVILIDNGSVDNTLEIAGNYNIRVLRKTGCTISALRNMGAENAKGEILAFLDADCIVPASWLSDAAEMLKDKGIGAVGCWYGLAAKPSFIEKIWDIHMGLRRGKTGNIAWIPSGNFIIRHDIFKQIDGFNESLITAEDVDICDRLRKAGLAVFSHPKLAVEHLGNPKDLREFCYKEYWRGKGVLQNLLANLPRLRPNKSICFALATLMFIAGIIIGTVTWGVYGNSTLLIACIIGIALAPFWLTLKTAIVGKKWFYFFPLMFLFLLFGVSRAFSVFSFEAWKSPAKGQKC